MMKMIVTGTETSPMLSLHNTLTKKKESFESIHTGKVGIYTCGPTVYGNVHIGNLRSYLTADLLRRVLECLGYEVRHIKNITDVGHLTADDVAQGDTGEDKIEKKARAEKKTPEEIARFYEEYFREAERKMNILPAHAFPRATAHIPDMIRLIETLLDKGFAYEKNGNVFLDVTSFKSYGHLSGNTLDTLKIGARLEEHPDKRHPWDFALWLKSPDGHLMHWTSPWGTGYPGWHIECSAMSIAYLGEQFDIHTGGEDNIFPHHEAEITQSECATGRSPFARFWIHSRHLLVGGEKMSKSKGNLYTLEDIEANGFSAMDLRMALLSSHYRSQMNFTWEGLEQAKKNRVTLIHTFHRLKKEGTLSESAIFPQSENANSSKNRFLAALNDDLNTPLALSILLEYAKRINSGLDNKKVMKESALSDLSCMLSDSFGLILEKESDIPDAIQALAEARQKARHEKNFPEADRLRDEIQKAGWSVEDTPRGYELRSF